MISVYLSLLCPNRVFRMPSFKKKVTRPPTQEAVQRKLAAIMGFAGGDPSVVGSEKMGDEPNQGEFMSTASAKRRGFLTHVKPEAKEIAKQQRKKLDIASKDGAVKETVTAPISKAATATMDEATTKEKQGMRLLRQAVKNQSHLRPMKHHERHDYEYRLRRVATAGVVRLFNALAAAQKVGKQEIESAEERLITLDKAEDQKLVASRDTFLSTLRETQKPASQWE